MSNKGLTYGIKLLSLRNYFKSELYSKIKSKFDDKTAVEAVETLEDMGYINDEVTVKSYIRQKLSSGYGPYYISNKLYEKGYPKDISFIENTAYEENIDMAEYIKKYSMRYVVENSQDSFRDYVKCINFLKNRGYALDLIRQTIKQEDFEK